MPGGSLTDITAHVLSALTRNSYFSRQLSKAD